MTFQTLPVERFGTIDGESVNIVDQKAIASQVSALLHPAPASTPDAGSDTTPSPTDDPATTAPSASPSPTSSVYTDSQQPMRAGSVPCVN